MQQLREALPDWLVFRLPTTGEWMAQRRVATRDTPPVYAPTPEHLYLLVSRLN